MNREMGRPLIGVTPWYDYEKNITFIKPGYCEGVNEAGGTSVLLPLTVDEEMINDLVSRFDGFLISGGPDVDARLYGEENLEFNGEISPLRDTMELLLIVKAFELNKPVFGICRGIQIMNVALGGTLYQDIAKQINAAKTIKHSQQAPKWYPTHDISIKDGSCVGKCLGESHIGVNSFHHQSVKDPAPGYFVTSESSDGVIESIEHNNHRFAVGVQWHPELMWKEDGKFLNLFRMFVDACK